MHQHDSTSKNKNRPAGYEALIRQYELTVIPNWHRSFVATNNIHHKIHTAPNEMTDIYPSTHWPGESLGDHLEFALKYDGINLATLTHLFQVVPEVKFLAYVESKPTGKYSRRLWFLYEWLTGLQLPIADLNMRTTYIDLLDPQQYFTITSPVRQVRRQRINDNLLGDNQFCPIIRRTETLRRFEAANLTQRCQQIVSAYKPKLLKRALSYLYTKETKSSFEIEHVKPNSTRTERFVTLLQHAEKEDFCEKSQLIDLQNRIVDARFCDSDYRTSQNYIGESVSLQREKVHFVCPKPEDLATLMEGLVTAHLRMEKGHVPAVIHATAIAYGFVFLHPFEDGNGRIHRFLIHNILARRNFTPKGIMFPVSASMLKTPMDYDASLEAFSQPLLDRVEYSLDENGKMTVHNDTALWYRYIDMTAQAEALFQFIEQTINIELVEELTFLANYDKTKQAIQEIVDMPDRQIDLFIRFCLQNNGQLSSRKRMSHFDFLSDDEITRIEQAFQLAYGRQ